MLKNAPLVIKLLLALALTVLIAVGSVALLVNRSVGQHLADYVSFATRPRMMSLALDLVAYYAAHGGWDGVEQLLTEDMMMLAMGRGRGMGGFYSQAQEKGITLSVQVDEPLPLVRGDSQRLAQVLTNLLSNALRYAPVGGRVAVRVWADDVGTHVAVQDDGPSIPAEDLSYLFERFYRADKARSRNDGGTGLCLSIARKLLEAHGSRIAVESTPDQDAMFTVSLSQAGAGAARQSG